MVTCCFSTFLVLFEELVKQHRVDLLVADRVRLTLAIADDQVGIYVFHFLSHQSKLRDALRINLFLVAKTHRLERQNRFAGFAHRLDLVLEPRGRRRGAELAICIDENSRATAGGYDR